LNIIIGDLANCERILFLILFLGESNEIDFAQGLRWLRNGFYELSRTLLAFANERRDPLLVNVSALLSGTNLLRNFNESVVIARKPKRVVLGMFVGLLEDFVYHLPRMY
jgi:hypothetical protein